MDRLAALVAVSPVVGGTHSILADVEVLRVVYVLVRAGLDAVDDLLRLGPSRGRRSATPLGLRARASGRVSTLSTYTWLQVDQDGTGDVARIVTLVVKDILPIAPFRGKVLQIAVPTDAVLLAELLPKLAANCKEKQHTSASSRIVVGIPRSTRPLPSVERGGECRVGVSTYCCCRTARPGL